MGSDRSTTRGSTARFDGVAKVTVLTVDQNGHPLPGTTVAIRDRSAQLSPAMRVATDERGECVVTLPTREVQITASRQSRVAYLESRVTPAVERIVMELVPATALSGRVVDELTGLPVPGALVSMPTVSPAAAVTTDDAGMFREFMYPRARAVHALRVSAPAYGVTERFIEIEPSGRWVLWGDGDAVRDQRGSGEPTLELGLSPELGIAGTIVDASGQPLAGVSVSAEGYYRTLAGAAAPDVAEARTDVNGRFLLGGLRRDISHRLVADAAGHAQARLEIAPFDGAVKDVGVIHLGAEAQITGVVVDSTGAAATGLNVRLAYATPPASYEAGGPGWLRARPRDAGFRVAGRGFDELVDNDGSFRFQGLPSGSYALLVRRGNELLVEEDLHTGCRAATDQPVVVTLPDRFKTLEGSVSIAGAPGAGASIEVKHGQRTWKALADRSGRFRMAGLDKALSYEVVASLERDGALYRSRRTMAKPTETILLALDPNRRR